MNLKNKCVVFYWNYKPCKLLVHSELIGVQREIIAVFTDYMYAYNVDLSIAIDVTLVIRIS